MTFVTLSLPLISAIINVGSTFESYGKALKFVRTHARELALNANPNALQPNSPELDDAHAIPTLTALIFLFVAENEAELLKQDLLKADLSEEQKKELVTKSQAWKNVVDRVEGLFA